MEGWWGRNGVAEGSREWVAKGDDEEGEGEGRGRKKKKRRFRAAAGIARLSVVKARSLCSILCASDDARLLPLSDADRGVSAVDVERAGAEKSVSRA